MATAYFALHASKYVWEALEQECDSADALLELAIERLVASGIASSVEWSGTAIVLTIPDVDPATLDERALEIERLASGVPYLLDGRWMFLPYACAGVVLVSGESHDAAAAWAVETVDAARRFAAAVVWGGSVETSRLLVLGHSARIGGDDSCAVRIDAVADAVALQEHRGHHVYAERIGETDRGLLFHGAPLGLRRFHGPAPLYVPPATPDREPSIVILFGGASDVPRFARSGGMCATDDRGNDMLACYAIHHALARRHDAVGVVLVHFDVDVADGADWVARLRSANASVKRSLSISSKGIAIVAEGAHDDLVVHADAVREHFSSRDVKIADGIARTGETAIAFLERVAAALTGQLN